MDSHGTTCVSNSSEESAPVRGWKWRISCGVTITFCWIMYCTLGFSYSFGNMTPYLTSYLRNATDATDLDYTDTIWIGSTGAVSSCLLMPVLGIISSRLPTRLYLFMGVLSTAASMFGTYRAVQVSFVLTVVTYGLVNGIPSAILYPAPIKIAARWLPHKWLPHKVGLVSGNLYCVFQWLPHKWLPHKVGLVSGNLYCVFQWLPHKWLPHKVGLVSGLVLTGYGCGAFAWNQVITWYINPDNLQPDVKDGDDTKVIQAEVNERTPLINYQDEDIVSISPDQSSAAHTYTTDETESVECRTHVLHDNQPQYRPMQLLKSRVFWTLWCLVFFSDLSASFVLTLFKAYGQTFIADDHFLTLVASFSSVFNAVARPFWGSLADKYRPRVRHLAFAVARPFWGSLADKYRPRVRHLAFAVARPFWGSLADKYRPRVRHLAFAVARPFWGSLADKYRPRVRHLAFAVARPFWGSLADKYRPRVRHLAFAVARPFWGSLADKYRPRVRHLAFAVARPFWGSLADKYRPRVRHLAFAVARPFWGSLADKYRPRVRHLAFAVARPFWGSLADKYRPRVRHLAFAVARPFWGSLADKYRPRVRHLAFAVARPFWGSLADKYRPRVRHLAFAVARPFWGSLADKYRPRVRHLAFAVARPFWGSLADKYRPRVRHLAFAVARPFWGSLADKYRPRVRHLAFAVARPFWGSLADKYRPRVRHLAFAVARPFWGSLADKYRPRMVALIAQCMFACLLATFVTCEVTGRVAYFIWVCGMFFTMCGYFSTIPLFTIELFGTTYFNANLGLVFTADALCSLVAAIVAADLKDCFGWHGVFFFSFGCTFTGILINLTFDLRCGSTIPRHMFVWHIADTAHNISDKKLAQVQTEKEDKACARRMEGGNPVIVKTVSARSYGPWKRRVACVASITCCFLTDCTLGFWYSFGNISPYLTSYLRNSTHTADLDYTDTLWIAQCLTAVVCILSPLVGLVSTRISTRSYLAVGVLFTAASFFGNYWTVQKSFPLTIVTYGIVGAVPIAIYGNATINIAARWMTNGKGLVTGIVLAGWGCGGFAWNQLTTWYINPDNLQPDIIQGEDRYYSQAEVLDRVPGCFLVLGGIFTGVQFLSVILTFEPPDNEILPTTGDPDETSKLLQSDDQETPQMSVNDSNSGGHSQGDKQATVKRQYRPKEALKSRPFWTVWLLEFFNGQGMVFVITLFKAYGQSFIPDDHFLSLVASFSGIANAASRPLWGLLADKIGYRPVAIYAQCILACMVATFVTCEVTGKVAFFIWVIVMFACIGGQYTMMPPIILGLFGSQYYNTLQGLADSNGLIGAVVNAVIAPSIKDAFGWHGIFFASFLFIFIGHCAKQQIKYKITYEYVISQACSMEGDKSGGTDPEEKQSNWACTTRIACAISIACCCLNNCTLGFSFSFGS
ncbi:hypothetical protein BaRGS_00012789 [Batillaria attramentaria]|uniref:Major facilitator superfamily (MFS) profile domain-containing protein n=1 Tax=Batillaria attramentaria TaxID=370345 RepID=A0ABD0L9Q5_9CAEN